MLSNLPRGLKTPPDPASDRPVHPARAVAGRIAAIAQTTRLVEDTMFDYFHVPGRTSLHERKLAAWALFVGERSRMVSSPDRSARSHRGMLPDFDPAIAVPDPVRRSIFRRLADFVRALGGPVEVLEIAPAASLSGPVDQPVGKAASVAYIGEGESRPIAERAEAATAPDFDHSRAA
jgi:hypothetical protein